MPSKIAVIISVFNATKYVANLADSLLASYPAPRSDIRFIFTDDASDEASLSTLYKRHAFFKRKDVKVVVHKKNQGYTRNVNGAIRLTKPDEDVVLLNSDTQACPGLFEGLRDIAASNPLCASVTPLTNHGTIAGIFNWPNGMEWDSPLTSTEVTAQLSKIQSITSTVQVPTPIGFCVYLPKAVLNLVGDFDEKLFPRGYGEENDWALRASRMGLRHYLALKFFVQHASGKSFKEEKNALIESAMKTLSGRYPEYHELVKQHLDANIWEKERWEMMLSISKAHRKATKRKLTAFILHNDPEHTGGGVELSVKNLSTQELESGSDVAQIFASRDQMTIRYFSLGSYRWEVKFVKGKHDSIDRLNRLFKDIDELQVHHLVGAPREIIALIGSCKVPKKTFALHDYWTICPTIKLIDEKSSYCAVPTDLRSCDRCLKTKLSAPAGSIQQYRWANLILLNRFDSVQVPSREARDILMKGFDSLKSPMSKALKIKVKPNRVLTHHLPQTLKPFDKRVIFLGAFSAEKGGTLINEIFSELRSLGYRPEIWGIAGVVQQSPLTVTSYRNPEELISIRENADGAIVCIPSVWPETFAYTFYEAISILRVPVVVGPFGHPAAVTKKLGIGCVMEKADSRSLLNGILECAKNYAKLQQRVSLLHFEKDEVKMTSPSLRAAAKVETRQRPSVRK